MRIVYEGEAKVTDRREGFETRLEDLRVRIEYQNPEWSKISVILNGHALKMSLEEARGLATSLMDLAGPAEPKNETLAVTKQLEKVLAVESALPILERFVQSNEPNVRTKTLAWINLVKEIVR